MIVALSCSGPYTSVACLDEACNVLFSASEETFQNASGKCLELLGTGLKNVGAIFQDVKLIVADIGPGSFIGVRVGVTIAKTLGYALEIEVGGVTSFDLIDANRTVVIPSKRGEYFVRNPGQTPYRTTDMPEDCDCVGFGPAFTKPHYPEARNASSLIQTLDFVKPESLLPQYLIEPSISTPKRAFIQPNR